MAQLVNKGGALFNEGDSSRQSTECFDQWLLWPECFPVLTIDRKASAKLQASNRSSLTPAGALRSR